MTNDIRCRRDQFFKESGIYFFVAVWIAARLALYLFHTCQRFGTLSWSPFPGAGVRPTMTQTANENLLNQLCEQASHEHDGQKLIALTNEIIALLDAKQT